MSIYKGRQLIAGNLNTSLNLPFTLFDYQWADHILNNASWLRADTFSWQSGAIYVSAYNKLAEEYATGTSQTDDDGITYKVTDSGFKIALPDQEEAILSLYSSTGKAWYYILDTDNQRFKLPREKPFDGRAKGNGMTLGVTDGTNNSGLAYYQDKITERAGIYGQPAGSEITGSSVLAAKSIDLTLDASKSGIVLNRSNTDSQVYLYFYVGETVQNANLINAGKIMNFVPEIVISLGHSFYAPSARFMEARRLISTTADLSYLRMGLAGYTDVFSKQSFNIKPVSLSLTYNGVAVTYNNYATFEFTPAQHLDEGSSLQNGKDYYVYVQATSASSFGFVVSLSDTAPANSRLIGGFHTECADVGTLTNNPSSGYLAGDIIPNSIWCIGFRPYGKTNGAAYIDILDFWGHIYLQSQTGINTTSEFGATITDTRVYGNHCLDMFKIGYRLPRDSEFTIMALGSNEKTTIQGAKDPVTTGGHVDTAGRRIISSYFLEDCCGVSWQWLESDGASGSTGWVTINLDDNTSGNTYGNIFPLLGGGPWHAGGSCGSGCRDGSVSRSSSDGSSSARGVSHNIVKNCEV